MKYKVSVYPESFKNRDKSVMNGYTKKITKLIPRCKYEVTLDELACYIENMHVWCPATFVNNEKKQANLESIQIFALDFDGGIDFYKALSRADKYKIPAALSYETMSSLNYSKFRLAFICCQEVTDRNLAVLIQNCLCIIFPEADNASMNTRDIGLSVEADLMSILYGDELFENEMCEQEASELIEELKIFGVMRIIDKNYEAFFRCCEIIASIINKYYGNGSLSANKRYKELYDICRIMWSEENEEVFYDFWNYFEEAYLK